MTNNFLQVTSFDPLMLSGGTVIQGGTTIVQQGAPSLTFNGVQTSDYTAGANELVQTDCSTNSVEVTLPGAPEVNDRVAIHNKTLTEPNVTTINAGGKVFDDGLSLLTIPLPGMGYELEYIGNNTWAIRVISVPVAALEGQFDPLGAAQAVSDALTPRVDALERRPIAGSPPKVLSYFAKGSITTGSLNGPGRFSEFEIDATVVRVRAGTVPTSTCTIQLLVNGTLAYTITLTTGQAAYDDVAAAFTIPVGGLVQLNCTAAGGAADLEFSISDTNGGFAPPVPTIGAVTIDSITPQAGALAVTFEYTARDDNDELDNFVVCYLAGATPPATINAGTVAATVSPNGTVSTYTVQITGLPNGAQESVAVFPVGASGQVGGAGTGTATTLSRDTTPPLPGTLALQTGTKSQVGGTLVYTPDPTATDFAGIWLREARGTTVAPATVTSGHPANGGLGTGAGLWVPGNGDTSPVLVGITDGAPSTNFAFSAFPQDTTGNVQTTPATTHIFTNAAPSAGQGQYGLVPTSFAVNYSQDFSGLTTATLTNDFALDQGWAHQTQGPSAKSNWQVMAEPGNSGNSICRMTGQQITNGWYNNSLPNFKSSWTGGITNGTGRFGARGNLKGAAHQFTYGAWEIRCRVVTPFVTGWKGGTIMLWPEGTPSPWPQDELDIWEVFNGGERQCNLHYNDGSKSPGTQISVKASYDITQWTYVTCLWEKPNATTGDPSRMRIWYNGVLVFDTGLPSASVAPTPSGTSQSKINLLLTNPPPLQLGFSLAYTNYGTLGFGSNPGNQYFDIDSINMWKQP